MTHIHSAVCLYLFSADRYTQEHLFDKQINILDFWSKYKWHKLNVYIFLYRVKYFRDVMHNYAQGI